MVFRLMEILKRIKGLMDRSLLATIYSVFALKAEDITDVFMNIEMDKYVSLLVLFSAFTLNIITIIEKIMNNRKEKIK